MLEGVTGVNQRFTCSSVSIQYTRRSIVGSNTFAASSSMPFSFRNDFDIVRLTGAAAVGFTKEWNVMPINTDIVQGVFLCSVNTFNDCPKVLILKAFKQFHNLIATRLNPITLSYTMPSASPRQDLFPYSTQGVFPRGFMPGIR